MLLIKNNKKINISLFNLKIINYSHVIRILLLNVDYINKRDKTRLGHNLAVVYWENSAEFSARPKQLHS